MMRHFIVNADHVFIAGGVLLVISIGPYGVISRAFGMVRLLDGTLLRPDDGPQVIDKPGLMEVFA